MSFINSIIQYHLEILPSSERDTRCNPHALRYQMPRGSQLLETTNLLVERQCIAANNALLTECAHAGGQRFIEILFNVSVEDVNGK